MRVNCHTHIFNLDSALSKGTLDIIERRVVDAVVETDFLDEKISSELGQQISKALAKRLAEHPRVDERQFLEGFLEELDQRTGLVKELGAVSSGLPAPIGGLVADKIRGQALLGLRSLVSRLTGLLRKKGNLSRSTLTDRIDFLLVAFQSELTVVADRLLEQIGQEDAVVALMMDIAAAGGTIENRKNDQDLYLRHRDDTVAAVIAHPGRILPFVGVHPGRKGSPSDGSLRSAVDLAIEAIQDWGFVGVKLYPALGYSPADPALDPIYQYCAEHGVPIMTHASGGGFFASEAARAFSDPKFLGQVLDQERFEDLKICLAHFGGSSGVKGLELARSRRTNAFGDTILSLMEDHPGVYTDLSFHEDPMKSDRDEQAYFDMLKALLAPGSVHRDRILFGSDYWLFRMKSTEAQYWQFFEERMTKLAFARIAEINPRNYLGLPRTDGTGASEPISDHVDFLIDNLELVKAHKGRPPAWLVAAVQAKDATAAAALKILRRGSEPSPKLLVKAFDSVLAQLTDRALAAPVQVLTPDGGWEIGEAKMRLGGLDLVLRATAKASLAIELLSSSAADDTGGVLGPVLGVTDTTVLPSFTTKSWLKYRLEGLLGLEGGGTFEPANLGLGFDAKKRVVLSDYRVHARTEPSTTAAIAADLRHPRFALSRSDVLSLGLDDAVSMRVTTTLGASANVAWGRVLSGNLNALGQALGIAAALDIEVGLGATLHGSVGITDDFRVTFARTRRNPEGKPFKVTVRKADSRSKEAGVELSAGVKFADPEVIEAVLAGALGEQLEKVDGLLAKAASELEPSDNELRNKLVERLGLNSTALSAIKTKRDELEEKATEAIDKIARAELAAGFGFEYSRIDERSILLEADLSAAAMRELHGDLVRGDLAVLLERAESEQETKDIEMVSFLNETTHTRSKSWGFSFGFLSRLSSARDFDFERVHEQQSAKQEKKISYLYRRGYEVQSQQAATFSGWKWSGELAANMPGFASSPTTRDFRYAIELRFEWNKRLGPKLIPEIADAAVLWKAVDTPDAALTVLGDFLGVQPTVVLRLRVRHDPLVRVLRAGGTLDPDLAALSLGAAMPFRFSKKDPVRTSVAERRRIYAGLWKRYLADRRKGRTVGTRLYGQMAERHFRKSSDGDKQIITAGKFDAKEVNHRFSWTFAGAVGKHPDLFRDLRDMHAELEGSWEAVKPEGTRRLVGDRVERLGKLSGALGQYWAQCFQIRAFGRYLIEAAERSVGGADLVESSLTIDDGATSRLLGSQRASQPHETVEEAE